MGKVWSDRTAESATGEKRDPCARRSVDTVETEEADQHLPASVTNGSPVIERAVAYVDLLAGLQVETNNEEVVR